MAHFLPFFGFGQKLRSSCKGLAATAATAATTATAATAATAADGGREEDQARIDFTSMGDIFR